MWLTVMITVWIQSKNLGCPNNDLSLDVPSVLVHWNELRSDAHKSILKRVDRLQPCYDCDLDSTRRISQRYRFLRHCRFRTSCVADLHVMRWCMSFQGITCVEAFGADGASERAWVAVDGKDVLPLHRFRLEWRATDFTKIRPIAGMFRLMILQVALNNKADYYLELNLLQS